MTVKFGLLRQDTFDPTNRHREMEIEMEVEWMIYGNREKFQ